MVACYEHDYRLVSSFPIQSTPPQTPELHGFFIPLWILMIYWLMALVLLGVAAYAVHAVRNKRGQAWVEAETQEIIDPVLGPCLIRLPVVGQNQSKGFVEFECDVDGSKCEFTDDFIDESGGTEGMTEAVERIRLYHSLATNPEQMKIYRNSLTQIISNHDALFPDQSLNPDTLRSSARLYLVNVMGDQAWFQFSSKHFMRGRPMCVTVDESGDVVFVGSG